jgi:hypothetical protein
MEATAECNMSTQLIVYFSDAVIRALYVWRQYRTAAACQVASHGVTEGKKYAK